MEHILGTKSSQASHSKHKNTSGILYLILHNWHDTIPYIYYLLSTVLLQLQFQIVHHEHHRNAQSQNLVHCLLLQNLQCWCHLNCLWLAVAVLKCVLSYGLLQYVFGRSWEIWFSAWIWTYCRLKFWLGFRFWLGLRSGFGLRFGVRIGFALLFSCRFFYLWAVVEMGFQIHAEQWLSVQL